MVCTDDTRIYELAKMFRSHGMIRECLPELQDSYKKQYPDLNPLFTFAVPGYNMRNSEFNAVLGLEQLGKLDEISEKRAQNLTLWLKNLDSSRYFTGYKTEGNSSFALPLVLNEADKDMMMRVERVLQDNTVEYRIGTAGGGNQARQPYLERYNFFICGELTNADHIHDYGLYIGNHMSLTEQQIKGLCEVLNEC